MNRRSSNLIKAGDAGPIAASASVRHAAGAACAPPPRADATSATPTIVLHRTADTIDAIEVTCPCGQTIIIECEYAEES